MQIYLDVLYLENFIMNYLILMLTEKFSKNETSGVKILLGAFIGALYVAILILFPNISFLYTVISKILLSIFMVALTFSWSDLGKFVKTLISFYISTFIFAGGAFCFLFLSQTGGFVRNGVVYAYWNSDSNLILLSTIFLLIMLKIFLEFLQYRLIKEKLMVSLAIAFENKIINFQALVDTGNSLRDPITNVPVVVVEFGMIKDILPEAVRKIFEDAKEDDLARVSEVISNSKWFERFRIIPFNSLGKTNGILIGFKPDCIEIVQNESRKTVRKVIVAIYNKVLSHENLYSALLSPELVLN